MKKLILLLLFIPLVSLGQTYKDIMSISSVDMYKKVSIENGYTFVQEEADGWITYGFDVTKDSINGDTASRWLSYNKKDHRFSLEISRKGLFGIKVDDGPYDLIVEEIKEKCKYFGIVTYEYESADWPNDDYVCYSCSESTYRGKIGFVVTEEGGIIRHFPDK